MKSNLKLILLCPLILGISPLVAQENDFDPTGEQAEASLPRQIRIQVEYIEMSLQEMSTLMGDASATKSDTILRQRVGALMKAGKAQLIENQMLVARSGEKATTESVREFIYPTEYEPAETPSTVKIEKSAEATAPLKDLATGPTPTAFETRNLGSTLEIEPTVGDNNTMIDVRLMPELVYHVENTIWSKWKDKRGQSDIQMPVFYTLRLNTAATVANGKPCLLGALSPKDQKGNTDTSRKIFIFLKADVVVVGR